MVAIKSHQSASFLKSPDAKITALLFYGTDAGLVSERARQAADAWAKRENPPGEILRVDEMDLDGDPGRLADELLTVAMFGGRKIVRTSTGRRINANLLKPLVAETALPSVLIVEAGNLKPTDALRKMFEQPAHAAAIACFPDEERDLGAVVDEEMKAAGLTISAPARDSLVARLGADRAMSRGEIEKLILYCSGRGKVEVEDVEAIVGDASELTIDRIVLAAAGGQGDRAVNEFSRAIAAGESAQAIILALQRHFMRLHRVCTQIDAGRPVADVMRSFRPPLHFKQKDALTAQARMWTVQRLAQALGAIQAAAKTARHNGALEDIVAERLVLSLTRLARASGYSGR
ncbi:DNA polymerase III subunit delta [Candidatus Filomicrobium marinum]|uniref:DNA-directed DNA polymerase n=2 Tax=Filomicrobium TaxID=119044 RepID=A0A0D6JD19_9HYPH|nr:MULTISPECIES: DNA polymerase III subunit delta [Filomicrobium]MCV0370546.1 DNA polymerase III subunit delta [Filomicrobium sp.]CFX07978.1 DNA polymerase III subunit delta [Candidatus Filomicrobium marinum]CPR16710.1 DNA polymerase III subunit delta [Candidatus Filomicrobium marinum]SDP59237.1 DNA polymerase III, delta subunit [Filomicrobium insigne]